MERVMFITILMGFIGMLMVVMGILTETAIIFFVGYVLVVSALIGSFYIWMLR